MAIPATIKILQYMRSIVNQYVIGTIVNDIGMVEHAADHFHVYDMTPAERDIFVQIAKLVGTEKEREINEKD